MAESAVNRSHGNPRRLKRILTVLLILLLVLAIALAVMGITVRLVRRSRVQQQTENTAAMTVVTAKPEVSDEGDELVIPGTVLAYMEAPIYARTNGYLKRWYQDIGSRVHRGQLLAELETPEVDRQLSQGRADLATARANANLAQTTNQRYQSLAARQAVSRQDAEDRAGDATAKAAAAISAEENVKRLADLQSFKRVTAPFDGVITARNTDVGALINAGQSSGTELFRVADVHVLRVYAQVPEGYAEQIQVGLQADLYLTQHPGRAFPVYAVRTSRALDPTARTLQVELQLDNADEQFLPGAYAEIHFKMPSPAKTLRLPANTILFRADGLQVATIGPDNMVKVKKVTQGRDFGKTVEIVDGLDANDQVVINPSDSIEDGIKVRIAPPPEKSKGGGPPSGGSDKDKEPGKGDGKDGKDKKSKDKGGQTGKDSKGRDSDKDKGGPADTGGDKDKKQERQG